MRRALPVVLTLALTACGMGMGGPPDQRLSTVALVADPAATPAAAAAAIEDVGARIALVAAPADEAWFTSLAAATDLHLSGPTGGDLSLSLLAMEPLGDTVIDLSYEGGTVRLVDALYDLDDRHFLDLMAFSVGAADDLQPLVDRILRYIATDVDPAAGVVFAVAVPDAATGDRLARLLAPGFFDALRCGDPAPVDAVTGRLRLFYGPEARVWCSGVSVEDLGAVGRIHAALVAGLKL